MFSMSGTTPKLKAIYVGPNWSTNRVTSSNYMFENCTGLRNFVSNSIDKTHANTGSNGYLTRLYETTVYTPYAVLNSNGDLTFYYDKKCGTDENYFVVVDGAETQEWLRKSSQIKSVSFESFGQYEPTSFKNWFKNCTALTTFNTYTLDDSKVTNMANMFYGCSSLTSIKYHNNNWNKCPSSDVTTDLSYMFYGCTKLSDIRLSYLESAANMECMFSNCSSLKYVYINSSGNPNNTSSMFSGCTSLERIYVELKTAGDPSTVKFKVSTTNSSNMFYGCTKLSGYKGTQVTTTDKTYARIDQGESAPGYFSPLNSKITYIFEHGTYSGYLLKEYTVLDKNFYIEYKPTSYDYVFCGWTATGAITQSTPTSFIYVVQGTCGDLVLTTNWKGDISTASVELSSETYTGQEIPLIVKWNWETLKKDIDYTQSQKVLNSGNYTIELRGKGDYASTKTVSLYVKKAPITVNIADVTKEYGKTDPALTYTLSQKPFGSDKIEGTLKRVEGENVGSYNIQKNTGFTNSNYDITIKTGTFTITPIAATVTPDAGQEKTYGDEDPVLTYSVDGLINSDKLTGALSRATGENVGSYAIEQGSLNNPNYTITIADGVVFTIKPKDVTVTPKANLSKEYGDPDPELEYEATLVGEDTFTGALSREDKEEIGKYEITQGTLANDNYNINFTTGVEFEIKPKEINNPTIVLDPEIAILSGGKAEPTVKVYNGGKLIDESEYTFLYKDNTSETDNAEVTISASTNSHYNFTGTRTKTFKIINEAQAWKITYKDIDDNELKVTYVPKGTTTSAPQIIKEGYEIEGVYTEKACNTKWDFTQAIDEDKIFYIKWQIKTYDITYMIDGIEYEPTDANASTKNVEFGATINYPEPEARVGYTFSGWNPKPETMPDDDHFTVEGSFIINTHTITYTIDGKEYKKITVKYNDAISLEANPDEKLGYEFSQWEIDGYETLPTTMPDKDIAISGSYIPKKFKLVFNADGKAVKTIDYEFDKDITLAIPQEAHKSYKFTMPPTGKLMPAKDLTVDGRFEINKFNIVYMLDDETYATIPTEAGSTIVLIDKPTRDGYTFSNWQTTYTEMPDENITIKGSFSPNPHKIVYKEEGKELETVTTAFGKDVASTFPKKKGYKYVPSTDIPEEMPDEDLVIDGKFEIIDYTLTYYLDFEEYVVVTMHYGEQITPEPEPIRPGYQFSGWGELPETMPDNNLSFYGTLEKLSYTITFMFDGKKTQEIHYAYGDAVKQPSMTSKTGYTFKWVDCPEYMPESNLTIEGAYIPNIYTITYMVCDTVYASAGIAYNTEIVPEEAPSLEGYTFSWGYIPEKMPDYDVTVTGKFTANGTTPVSALPETADAAKVWSYNGTIYIETLPDTKYKITDINGRILTTSTTKSTHDEININQSGILIVIIGNQAFKVMN